MDQYTENSDSERETEEEMTEGRGEKEYNYELEEEDTTEMKVMGLDISEAIIDLYQKIKVRSLEGQASINESVLDEERETLSQIDSLTVLGYIRNSFDMVYSRPKE